MTIERDLGLHNDSLRRKARLNRRHLSDPDKAASRTREIIAEWDNERIDLALGRRFERSTRVVLVRPRWMPAWLYTRLLRSIVVEAQQRESERGRHAH